MLFDQTSCTLQVSSTTMRPDERADDVRDDVRREFMISARLKMVPKPQLTFHKILLGHGDP